MKKKNVLIITSSGGGGLLQAANAKEQECLDDPNTNIIKKDVLRDWIGKLIGQFGIRKWNESQKKGNVRALETLLHMQKYAEYLFWLRIYAGVFKIFRNHDIDRVIDTQVLGTGAIVKVIRHFNKKRKKQVYLEKVIVDLPTAKATHFFRAIKQLSDKDRKFVKIVTIDPLLEKGETNEIFWQKNTKMTEQDICYEYYPIRKSFKRFQDCKREAKPFSFHVGYKSAEECELMRMTYCRGPIKASIIKGEVAFVIQPEDKVFTLLLGSQPAYESTINYVKHFIKTIKESSNKCNFYLFVFCSDHKIGEESLFQWVHDVVTKIKDYPKNLSVIPMSFQHEEVIAHLFFRSDLSITRSGGQTAMELMSVSSGEKWIHSEAKLSLGESEIKKEELLKGIPGWEAGNACYLEQKYGAKIVTPETFESLIKTIIGSSET